MPVDPWAEQPLVDPYPQEPTPGLDAAALARNPAEPAADPSSDAKAAAGTGPARHRRKVVLAGVALVALLASAGGIVAMNQGDDAPDNSRQPSDVPAAFAPQIGPIGNEGAVPDPATVPGNAGGGPSSGASPSVSGKPAASSPGTSVRKTGPAQPPAGQKGAAANGAPPPASTTGPTGQANPSRRNLARGAAVMASSYQSPSRSPKYAVDGDTSTLWESEQADLHWIYVDFGTAWIVTEVRLLWEREATRYRVEVSPDGSAFTTAYETSHGASGWAAINLPSVVARYVRVVGDRPSSRYGCSLREFEVR